MNAALASLLALGALVTSPISLQEPELAQSPRARDAAAPAGAQNDSAGAVAFGRELERVQQRMDRAEWKAARRQLDLALEAHTGERYVLGRLGEVELVLKRCAFWEHKGALDVASLVEGQLVRSDAARGTLTLRYGAGEFPDFDAQSSALIFDVEFSGPYEFEVSGDTDASVAVCAGPGSMAQLTFGLVETSGPGLKRDQVRRFVQLKGQWRDARGERAEFVVDEDAAGVIAVSVQETQVKATFDGRSVLAISKPRDLWGTLAFAPSRPPRGAYSVEGEAIGWHQRQRDVVFQREWPAFEAQWSLADSVPSWIATALAGPKHAGLPAGGKPRGVEPEELSQSLVPRWNALADATKTKDLETVAREAKWLLRREPDLGIAALLGAQALEGLRQRDDAIAMLTTCVERHPAYFDAAHYLSRLLLVSGRFQASLDVIAGAIQSGLPAHEFQEIAVTATKGLRGPAWSGKFAFSSRHYDVASDLSRDACREVANELEESLRQVSRRIGVDLGVPSQRFQVYVFSGNGSYRDYLDDVFDVRLEHTQGMYSPFLKQLLVLRTDPLDEFHRTARHEGFHQLLDSVMAAPPLWVNEGLAEYFAGLKAPDGRWDDGRVLDSRLQTLQTAGRSLRDKLVPLQVFVRFSQPQFMQDGRWNYAQAWAFIHYLKHSSVKNEDALEALLAELMKGTSHDEAIDKAFGGLDWRALDAGLLAHIEAL